MNSIIQSLDEHINEPCYSSLLNIMEKDSKSDYELLDVKPARVLTFIGMETVICEYFLDKSYN